MKPVHHNMYVQQAYTLPSVQYPPINPPLPQYARGQEAPPPMYLVHHQPVYQYPAVGVPSEVLGSPIQQMPVAAMAVPSISGYPPQGWAAPSTPVWGYGLDRTGGYAHEQEQRMSSNWPPRPPQGRPVNGGNGGGNGGASSNFHRRVEGYGHPQGFASTSGGEGRRHDRGIESPGSRQYASGSSNRLPMARQPPPPPRFPADSQVKPLSCEPCEKTFQIPSQLAAHMNTHVVCEEIGCSFSASGKVVKLHKETAHCKSSHANSNAALKGASKLSGESNEEIRSWREERKRNYPTRTNVQRKKDEMEGRLARGELIDEDSRRRKQRMKEILAKQAELGVPVAEVPAYYLSLSHKDQRPLGSKEKNDQTTQNHKEVPSTTGSQRSISNNVSESKKRKKEVVVEGAISNDSQLVKVARVNEDSVIGHSNSLGVASTELSPKPLPVDSQVTSTVQSESGAMVKGEDGEEAGVNPLSKSSKQQCYFYQRGRCKKGAKCHYAHTGPRNKKGGDGEASRGGRGNQKGGAADKKRPPTLLSKLLESSILRDKSYILQCLRYFVNNNFLVDWPNQSTEVSDLDVEEDTSCENNSDNSDGEVVEEPDVLAADSAIINCLLSERPEVLADVLNSTENVELECEV